MFDSSRIRPKNDYISDKYSWNLYRAMHFIEEDFKKSTGVLYKIIWYDKSSFDGSINTIDVTVVNRSLDTDHLYILKVMPHNQGEVVLPVGDILTVGATQDMRFLDVKLEDTYIHDITEWFLREYWRSGRCIFDREHIDDSWSGTKGRLTIINKNSRRCNWCGKYLKRSVSKVVTVTREEIWA